MEASKTNIVDPQWTPEFTRKEMMQLREMMGLRTYMDTREKREALARNAMAVIYVKGHDDCRASIDALYQEFNRRCELCEMHL